MNVWGQKEMIGDCERKEIEQEREREGGKGIENIHNSIFKFRNLVRYYFF